MVLATGLLLALPVGTRAENPADECLATFSLAAAESDRHGLALVCRDGDPVCDTDGTADGACTVDPGLCIGTDGCTDVTLATLLVRGRIGAPLRDAVAALPSLDAGGCVFAEPLRIRAGKRRRLRLVARTQGGRRDRDRLTLTCRRAAAARALVVTSDFESGILARARVTGPHRPRRLGTRIHSDAVIRTHGADAFVINRFLADNVQVVGSNGHTRLQCTTGAGSNPHDIAVVAPDKAYVTRYDRGSLLIVNPSAAGCGGFRRGTIDLVGVGDGDGLPEMSQMAVVGDRLFVSVQRLDRRRGFAPTGGSALAVIDPTRDVVETTVELVGQNAFGDASGILIDPATGDLLLAQAGNLFQTGDGGIERVDPVALESLGFIITEDRLGGSITDFVMVGATRGYAIVLDETLRNLLVTFDTESDAPARRVFASGSLLPDVTLAPDGTVWLASRPGIRIFDAATGNALRTRPLDLGLPPFSIGFLP